MVPDGFRCPITQEVMTDPVIVYESGHTVRPLELVGVRFGCARKANSSRDSGFMDRAFDHADVNDDAG